MVELMVELMTDDLPADRPANLPRRSTGALLQSVLRVPPAQPTNARARDLRSNIAVPLQPVAMLALVRPRPLLPTRCPHWSGIREPDPVRLIVIAQRREACVSSHKERASAIARVVAQTAAMPTNSGIDPSANFIFTTMNGP
jgi:hypothetical protein